MGPHSIEKRFWIPDLPSYTVFRVRCGVAGSEKEGGKEWKRGFGPPCLVRFSNPHRGVVSLLFSSQS